MQEGLELLFTLAGRYSSAEFGHATDIYSMLGIARYQFDMEVGGDIYLLYLLTPDIIVHKIACYGTDVIPGVVFADVSGGYYQIADILRIRHYATLVVDIVVFIIIIVLDADEWRTLSNGNEDVTLLGNAALGFIDERHILELGLYLTRVGS